MLKQHKTYSLYVIESGGFYKVGITSDFIRRLTFFETNNPFPVRLVVSRSFLDRRSAWEAEQRTHRILKDMSLHHKLEWFKSSDDATIIRAFNEDVSNTLGAFSEIKIKIKKRLQERKKHSFLSSLKCHEAAILSRRKTRKKITFSPSELRDLMKDRRVSVVSEKTGLKPNAIRAFVKGMEKEETIFALTKYFSGNSKK